MVHMLLFVWEFCLRDHANFEHHSHFISTLSHSLSLTFFQARDAAKFDMGNIDPQKQAGLRFGRPNLPHIFR